MEKTTGNKIWVERHDDSLFSAIFHAVLKFRIKIFRIKIDSETKSFLFWFFYVEFRLSQLGQTVKSLTFIYRECATL